MEKKSYKCRVCETPNSLEKELIQSISNDEIDLIFDFIAGEVNSFHCKVCGNKTIAPEPIIFLNTERNEAVFFLLIPNLEDFQNELKTSILNQFENEKNIHIPEIIFYNDFTKAVWGILDWFKDSIAKFINIYFSKSYKSLSDREKNNSISKLILNYLALVNTGHLTLQLSSDAVSNKELFHYLLIQKLDLLYKNCVEERNIESLMNIIAEEIPRRCFTPKSFDTLTSFFPTIEFNESASFQEYIQQLNKSFKVELLVAIVADFCQVQNPRVKKLSTAIVSFWYLKQNQNIEIDENYFLNSELAQALLSFESLWDSIFFAGKEDFNNRLQLAFEIFNYYGFEKEFERTLSSGEVIQYEYDKDDEEIKDTFFKNMVDLAFKDRKINDLDYEESIELGILIFGMFKNIHSFTEDIDYSFDSLLQLISEKANKNKIASVYSAYKSIMFLNTLGEIEKSIILNSKYGEYSSNLKPYEYASYLIELGNTLRYSGHLNQALDTYKIAEKAIQFLNTDETLEVSRILKQNIAIINRDLKRYDISLKHFKELIEENKSEPELYHNVAILYSKLNDLDAAVNYLKKGMSLALKVEKVKYLNYSITLSYFYFKAEKYKESLKTIDETIRLIPEPPPLLFTRLCSVGMLNPYITTREFTSLKDNLYEVVFKGCQIEDVGLFNLKYTSIVTLAQFHIKNNEVERANQFLEIINDNTQIEINDWQYFYCKAWVHYERKEFEESWSSISKSVSFFKIKLPNQKITEWLQDIEIEEFYNNVSHWSFSIYLKGIINEFDLIEIFDLVNGFELTSKLSNRFDIGTKIKFQTLYQNENVRDIDFFFFYETIDLIYIIHYIPFENHILIDRENYFEKKQVLQIKKRLKKCFKNYLSPALSERKFEFWKELQLKIGFIIAKHAKNETVCLLQGETFSNIPIHLGRLNNEEFLIDRYSLVNGINFTSFIMPMLGKSKSSFSSSLLVNVFKENDTDSYKKKNSKFAKSFIDHSKKKNIKWKLLENTNATKINILEVLEVSDEVCLVCHGVEGNIAISNGEYLPPSHYIKEKLRDFFLTWQDFENITNTPKVIVSSACSSASLTYSKAGVIIGLGQGIWTKGTDILICPLWDINQDAGFFWLEAFYEYRNDGNTSIIEAFKKATITTKKKWKHPFYWAPFIYFGNINSIKNGSNSKN